MKKTIAVAIVAVVLAVLAALVWHNHRRIAGLENSRSDLLARLAARGIDPAADRSGGPAKSIRPDADAEASRIADGFIAYAKEMEALGPIAYQQPDKATRQRMISQMDRIMSLNGRQLVVVIDEVAAADGFSENVRWRLLRFLVRHLGRDYPERALNLIVNPSSLSEYLNRNRSGHLKGLVSDIVGDWAGANPESASDWFRENREKLSEETVKAFRPQINPIDRTP